MAKVKKLPYYQMGALPLAKPRWREFKGVQGCVPISTQQSVSMERLAPGEMPKYPPPKQPTGSDSTKPPPKKPAPIGPKKDKPQAPTEEPVSDAEPCEKPPVFDMLDIPEAMEHEGWPVSAKLARRWFNSPKLIWDNDVKASLPIEDTAVTLEWALKFGLTEYKLNKLVTSAIYDEAAIIVLKAKLRPLLERAFMTSSTLDLSTASQLSELSAFHQAWNFQHIKVAHYETAYASEKKSLGMTDLTGALANFNIYAAIGKVEVAGERYFKYDKQQQTKTYCLDPVVRLTHIYAYIRDNYSFNDDPRSSKTQYLGHWNKSGMIVTTGGAISEFFDGAQSGLHTDLGNNRVLNGGITWDYLMDGALDKPVDARRGFVRKFRPADVYFPVYNKSFNEWRQKHNRGGDFWIYSKPKLVRLGNPIEFTLGTLCRAPEAL